MLEPEETRADDEEPGPDPPTAKQRKSRGGSATFLSAAMLAIGEIFEPEKTTVEIIQTDDDPVDDPPFDLDFGDLPPLE
jgi:hypothetical protein